LARAIFSISAHSFCETGMTERREIRTSGKSRKDLSALISARVTGRFSFLTGAMSQFFTSERSSRDSAATID